VFGEVGLVSGHVRRGRVISVLIEEVWLVAGRVGRGRFIVGTCPAMTALYLDVFGGVGLVSVLVRQGRVSVGKCSAKSA